MKCGDDPLSGANVKRVVDAGHRDELRNVPIGGIERCHRGRHRAFGGVRRHKIDRDAGARMALQFDREGGRASGFRRRGAGDRRCVNAWCCIVEIDSGNIVRVDIHEGSVRCDTRIHSDRERLVAARHHIDAAADGNCLRRGPVVGRERKRREAAHHSLSRAPTRSRRHRSCASEREVHDAGVKYREPSLERSTRRPTNLCRKGRSRMRRIRTPSQSCRSRHCSASACRPPTSRRMNSTNSGHTFRRCTENLEGPRPRSALGTSPLRLLLERTSCWARMRSWVTSRRRRGNIRRQPGHCPAPSRRPTAEAAAHTRRPQSARPPKPATRSPTETARARR